MKGIQLISEQLIGTVVEQARQSTRLRRNHNFHTSDADNPHRFLNVFLAGTYVRPHRHLTPPKAESFLVMSGSIVVLLFDDDGRVTDRYPLGDGQDSVAKGIDLQPGIWHSVAALTPVAVCYEVKPGPWDPATDKEFAPWAPEEGSPEAGPYLATLLD